MPRTQTLRKLAFNATHGWITKGCTRSTHSGGCEVVGFSFVPGEPRRYTASGANTDMIVGARDMFATHSLWFATHSLWFATHSLWFATHSLWFVTYSCGFATCSPRSIPYSQHPRLPRGGRHRINDETCWFTTGQHDTMRVQVSTIDTRKTRYNNTMHTERRSPCVLKWRVTCRRPVIVDVIPTCCCFMEMG